jgi:hypothetical protein
VGIVIEGKRSIKTIREVESPMRFTIEKEAKLNYFTLTEKFILKYTGFSLFRLLSNIKEEL